MSSVAAPQIIHGKTHAIGMLSVVRVLPTRQKRSVGPFVFVDHMAFETGAIPVVDVAPHPHIGISTVTYLFEGSLIHRDSLGTVQRISPGAVNWMTAGRGIVHSERTPEEVREQPPVLFGVQCWVALPLGSEDIEPHFEHYGADELPCIRDSGTAIRLVAGELMGELSPVRTASPLLCAAVEMEEGSSVVLEGDEDERALIVLSGEVRAAGTAMGAEQMGVFGPGQIRVETLAPTRAFLIGGPVLAERRYMDWNFVATDRERIERAKERYRARELGVIAGESEQLPLPEDVR